MTEDEATDADESDDARSSQHGTDADDSQNATDTDSQESTDADLQTDTDAGRSRAGEFGVAADAVGGGGNDVGDSPAAGRADDASADDLFEEGGADADAPLSSLAASVENRRERTDARPDDELFDEESVPEIDADAVWERLGEDEPPELPDDTDHDVRVVEKRSYCEQCPFFSTPPDVQCTNDGTEILELVDMEHFQVVDCPKVRENEQLERL